MGRNKRKHLKLEDVLGRPWCYYCERDFDDLKILINHQKAKHYKCERCGRRLNTAGGLSVHMNQVHKESLNAIENALPNRQGVDVEVFGMEGIPDDVMQNHNGRVVQNYATAEAERRAATGNPAPGSKGGVPSKKPRIESPEELKKRLKEYVEKRRAERAAAAAGAPTSFAQPQQQGQPLQSAFAPPGSFAQYPGNQNAPPSTQAVFVNAPLGQSAPANSMPPQANGHSASAAVASGLPQRPLGNTNTPANIPAQHGLGDADANTANDTEKGDEKKSKKDKDKNTRLIYGDNEFSPEEKMARMARYTFVKS